MFINDRFSNKNKLIYKMKYINTRDSEYIENKETNFDKIEKYKGKGKKIK